MNKQDENQEREYEQELEPRRLEDKNKPKQTGLKSTSPLGQRMSRSTLKK